MDKDKNIVWSKDQVSYERRCEILGQKGLTVWFTGLSGSGKSTVAIELQKKLTEENFVCYRLDGDNIRHGLNSDLGFGEKDREENLRRIAEVAALFQDAGLITLVSFISPYEKMRRFARSRTRENAFLLVYVKSSLETCIQRDVKGLYKKALAGEISDFTGVSAPYEEPENPDIVLDTDVLTVEECVERLYRLIVEKVR
ncbi:MAG: adenylyl-sulfate kinase [Clostridia bacterium]|jgi:adenylyl-sulfate kinase|nr:adenylyl-sulfate kinase [Clostridiaceae bacterium]